MAKFNSIVFNEVSGKMGAMVLNKNGTARARVTPRNPDTAAQQAIRNSFAAANAAWKALTSVQQAGWSALARTIPLKNAVGKSYNPTGRHLYLSCYQNAHTVSLAAPANPPAFVPTVPGVGTLSVAVVGPTSGHAGGQITPSWTTPQPSYSLVLRATGPLSPDRSFLNPSAYRLLTAAPPNGALPGPDALAAIYAAKFGVPHAGAKISFGVFLVDANGFVGPVSRADVLVSVSAQAAAPAPSDDKAETVLKAA